MRLHGSLGVNILKKLMKGTKMDEQNTEQNVAQSTSVQVNNFEQKAKDTIEFLGETWGYSAVLMVLIVGVLGRKRIKPFIKNQLKKFVDSL